MWQLRVYLQAVASGKLSPMHEPCGTDVDHRRVFRAVRAQVKLLMSTWPDQQQVRMHLDLAAPAMMQMAQCHLHFSVM